MFLMREKGNRVNTITFYVYFFFFSLSRKCGDSVNEDLHSGDPSTRISEAVYCLPYQAHKIRDVQCALEKEV